MERAEDHALNDEAFDHHSADTELDEFIKENAEQDDTSMDASMLSSESVKMKYFENAKEKSLARLINHYFNPNYHAHKWLANGCNWFGMFAKKSIKQEEI